MKVVTVNFPKFFYSRKRLRIGMTEYCFGFGISIIPAIFAISALLPAAIATQVKGLCLSSPPYNKVIFCLIKISCNSGYKYY